MNYEEMSDFEINKRVAEALGLELSVEFDDWIAVSRCPHVDGLASEFDPCNNPSDAWPVIKENSISIYFTQEDSFEICCAYAGDFEYEFVKSNLALRAAMIVYLMMQEEK